MQTDEEPGSVSGGVPHRVTMKEVAGRCGVSLSTVSLVLSGDQRIPFTTTQRVLEVVKALGYRPNMIARSLAKQRTKTIGLVIPDPDAVVDRWMFSEALNGVTTETSRQGYRLLLEIATPQFISRRFYLRLLKENSVDGVIYLAAGLNDEFLREAEPFRYPFVLIGGYLDGIQLSYAVADDEAAGAVATGHLAGLGHVRIGHIAGPATQSSSRDRARGYRRALEKAGLPFDPALVAEGRFSVPDSQAAAHALLDRGATAIFAGNDLMASAALQAVKQAGRRVPEDVAIAGVGDTELARLADPPMTSVGFDAHGFAGEATRRVIQQIERGGNAAAFQEKNSVRLIVRQTSG